MSSEYCIHFRKRQKNLPWEASLLFPDLDRQIGIAVDDIIRIHTIGGKRLEPPHQRQSGFVRQQDRLAARQAGQTGFLYGNAAIRHNDADIEFIPPNR